MSGALRVTIVADDLTGAADTAVAFARRGLETLVVLDDGPLPHADVLAISTESRHVPEDVARERIRRAVTRLATAMDPTVSVVYKKIDSTLRGHPGAELDALMNALGIELALAAPAFPAQGRTTVGGRQMIEGVHLEETPFGREVATSRVAEALAVAGRPSALLDLAEVRAGADAARTAIAAFRRGVLVADAETDADLSTLVAASRQAGVRLLCGAAGLGSALAAAMLPVETGHGAATVLVEPGPVLVVAASRHPRTLAQIEKLRRAGVPTLVPAAAFFAGNDRKAARMAAEAAELLARHGALVLTTAGHDDLPHDPPVVAARLARLVRRIARSGVPGGLLLTGGDIAAAVCRGLGAAAIRLQGEVEPGMPWGTLEGGVAPGALVVTKAGAFGDDRALLTAVEFLTALG